MKKIIAVVCSAFMMVATLGCQSNKTRVAEGSVIGGLLGGAAGGIIGHQSGHGGEGAAIGIAAGALTGALIGSQINKPAQTETAAQAQPQQAANPNQMTLQQVVDLSKQGVSETVIIDKLKSSNSKFNLTQADIDYLKQQKVPQSVIDVMSGK
ncbi:MAG: glycine zipper 2TM domain-containing protein [Candidatus Omnitrophica bacterium]|nr:glycine zipper 2TM domain-containing protein [Candidatus Omnitrophota bacterium]